MLSMPSLLESRNSLLHLWTSLERKRIQPTSSPMAIGCSLSSPWFSTRRNCSTERACCGPQCAEKMHQKNMKEFTFVSYEIHYIVTRNSKIGCTEEKCIAMDKLAQEDHSYRRSRGIFEISKTLVSHIKQIGQECTDETPIRLPRKQSQ